MWDFGHAHWEAAKIVTTAKNCKGYMRHSHKHFSKRINMGEYNCAFLINSYSIQKFVFIIDSFAFRNEFPIIILGDGKLYLFKQKLHWCSKDFTDEREFLLVEPTIVFGPPKS